MKLTLIILAAGWGSRYGGLKQVDGFGSHGESLMDYSVFDAKKAGFNRFVFVIREELRPIFDKKFRSPLYQNLDCQYVLQDVKDCLITTNRTKPWGTAHAVYSCRKEVKSAFGVINADDFYGAHSFQVLADYLKKPLDPQTYGMIGFRLKNSLSLYGSVSRGICSLNKQFLKKIEEVTHIHYDKHGKICDSQKRYYSGNEFVSMNCWAFLPSFFDLLEKNWEIFLQNLTDSAKSEFMLPMVVHHAVETGYKVLLFPTTSQSFGITYIADKQVVSEQLRQMEKKQVYPTPLSFPQTSVQ